MKNKIIDTSIESLRNEGLRFSVDTIASKLKISKKTIYKFFPDKEALAYAIYEKYYAVASEKINKIKDSDNDIKYQLLMIYFDALFMMRKEIFNKYKLNDCIYSYALKRQNELWSRIIFSAVPSATEAEGIVLRTIIEGSFEKLSDYSVSLEHIIGKLVTLL